MPFLSEDCPSPEPHRPSLRETIARRLEPHVDALYELEYVVAVRINVSSSKFKRMYMGIHSDTNDIVKLYM